MVLEVKLGDDPCVKELMGVFCEIIPYFLLKITLQEYEQYPGPYKLCFQWKTKYHRNKPE